MRAEDNDKDDSQKKLLIECEQKCGGSIYGAYNFRDLVGFKRLPYSTEYIYYIFRAYRSYHKTYDNWTRSRAFNISCKYMLY